MKSKRSVFLYVVGMAACVITTFLMARRYYARLLKSKEKRINKFVGYFNLFDQWFSLKEEGKSIDDILIGKGYKNIAIYGMGVMGNHLYNELKNGKVSVEYCIDRNYSKILSEIDVVDISEDLDYVDAIVVTPVFEYEEIKSKLSAMIDYDIISLNDLLFDDEMDEKL